MKTVRLNHSSINSNLLPNITGNTSTNSSPKPASTPNSTPTVNNSNSLQQTSSSDISNVNGLVRRLSVTARPGDIFYKVKDVAESSSTTDQNTQAVEQNGISTNMDNHHIEQEIIIQTTASNSVAASNVNKPVSEAGEQQQQQSQSRKITTWNVKRNQNTNLGLNPNQNNSDQFLSITSKDDSNVVRRDQSNEHVSEAASSSNGGPMFSKELLSIR